MMMMMMMMMMMKVLVTKECVVQVSHCYAVYSDLPSTLMPEIVAYPGSDVFTIVLDR